MGSKIYPQIVERVDYVLLSAKDFGLNIFGPNIFGDFIIGNFEHFLG